jgi:hypothetical protein
MRIVINTDIKKIILSDKGTPNAFSNFAENPFRYFSFFKQWLDLLARIPENEPSGTPRIHVWHIAAPKTGSTWLTVILSDLLKWNVCPLIPDYDRREQEIEITNLLYSSMHNSCFSPHQHCRYSQSTRLIIEKLGITPVLQYRNIFDTVVSFYDHCNGMQLAFPMAYMDEKNWKELDNERRMDFIIDLIVPWFFNFYAGWFSSDLFKDGKIILVSYDDLVAHPHAEVKRILARIGIEKTDDEINSAILLSQDGKIRKNVGTSGRSACLSPEQRQRIRTLAGYYPHIDFTLLGL